MRTIENENSLVLATINSALPAFAGGGVSYNDIARMFLTMGWTSLAGNTYLEGMRYSDKIVLKYNIGQGYYYTFLNGISIYAFDGRELKLIASRSYYCCVMSDRFANDEASDLLSEFFENQCRANGLRVDRSYVADVARRFVSEAIKHTEAVGNYVLASSDQNAKMLAG